MHVFVFNSTHWNHLGNSIDRESIKTSPGYLFDTLTAGNIATIGIADGDADQICVL